MPESGHCQPQIPIFVHQEFQYRLEQVLSGRRPYPWAESLGITRGTVGRMLKGEIPGPEILGLIMRAENVSITWLTTGVGAPYLVHWCATDEACRQHLDELLALPGWRVHLLTDGGRVRVLVLHCRAEVEYKGAAIPYTELAVLAGVGPATLARVNALESHRETRADTETVAAVASGQKAGWWQLLGENGLLHHYETIDRAALKVAEPGETAYQAGEPDAISEEERAWIDMIRQLDPDYRVRLREVGDAFLAARRHRRTTSDGDE